MSVFTTSFNGELCPPELAEAITVALLAGNPFASQFRIRPTGASSVVYPTIAPTGLAWVAEGQPFNQIDLHDSAVTATPTKVGGIFKVAVEAWDDSTANLGALLGDGVRRTAQAVLDLGLYAGSGVAPVPTGALSRLPAIAGGPAASLRAGIHAAVAELIDEGSASELVAFVPSGKYAAEAGREAADGTPLYPDGLTSIGGARLVPLPSTYGSSVAVMCAARAEVVQRDDLALIVDRSAYFATDELGVKVRGRFALGIPDVGQAGRTFTVAP